MFVFFRNPRWTRICLPAIIVFLTAFTAVGQEIVDKTVAVVSDGARSELITYSDLVWQLALQPGVQLDPPRSEDLNQALQTLINQGIFALEAQRLPRDAPFEGEIAAEISRTLRFFPSASVFETRLKQVGFDSIKDPAFERLIAKRLSISKYTDFRFRSFVVVSADEETRYYRDIFVPDFRRRFPGLLMPTLDEKRAEIKNTLTENKVAERIEGFLDEAKRRVRIEILIEV
jgi:hypothetical protein